MTLVADPRNAPSNQASPASAPPRLGLVAVADPFTAAERGDLATLRGHLAHGLSPDAERAGASLLELACAAGQERVATALLDARARVGIALHAASAAGHPALVSVLLDRGADPEARDRAGFSPLLTAIAAGHEAVALLLLRRGATVHVEVGDTGPLALARRSGSGRLVGLLRQLGARA
jgi:ankyrin repeat protein